MKDIILFKWKMTWLRIPTGGRKPVGSVTSMDEDLNSKLPTTNPASFQGAT